MRTVPHFVSGLALLILLSFILFPLPKDKIEKNYSRVIRAEDNSILRSTLSKQGTYRFHTPLNEISDYVKKGFIKYEDKYFFLHPGINPIAIVRASILNWKRKKIVSGASTISMQVARMLEPKSRTFPNKIIEIIRAFQLEIRYSKKKLLEIYLNLVPMGGNIEGVGAASRIYFQKDVFSLSPAEASVLIAIPRSPNINRPDKDNVQTSIARNKILKVLEENKIIDKKLYTESIDCSVKAKIEKFPFLAPHLTTRVMMEYKDSYNIKLSLKPKLQDECKKIARLYISKIRKYGVNNLAILVIHNPTMKALAYIGSEDFFDQYNNGQVDGVIAMRSPGSTLKPFIYGLALDKGLLTPAKILYDIPKSFHGYSPLNYSHEFLGAVSMKMALIHSLNVPAVETLGKLSYSSMETFLDDIGVNKINLKNKGLGLSVALGAHSMSLENLVSMFAGLANGGMLKKIIYFNDKKTYNIKRIMSAESAYLVTDILSSLLRPDMPASWEYTGSLPRIAWKTGTSFGLSDAWSVGYNPEYTVGVWVGNFTGKSSPALVGIETATPLLFDVFNEIARGSSSWFTRPAEISERKVCAVSGDKAGPYCPEFNNDFYIPGVSSESPCSIHKKIICDKKTGFVLCDYCREGRPSAERILCDYPEEYGTWLKKEKIKTVIIPSHNPACSQIAGTGVLKIKFPKNKETYYFRQGMNTNNQAVSFSADSPSDTTNLFWLVDKKLYVSAKPQNKVFFKSKPGEYKLTCIDNYGRSDEIEFKIRYR